MSSALMWSELYRPKKIEQMVGNEEARLAVVKWLSGWVSGTKPLLLVGPPGTGKTTLVHALVRQFDYDLVETNASDTRSRDSLEARIIPVLNNRSIFGRKMMLFLDEVDGISGREDTGGLDALVDMMKEPTVPVIMAANSKSVKIKELAKVCKTIEFSPVPPRLLLMFLDHVLSAEGKNIGPGDKIALIINSKGDIRTLLNSAQSAAAGYAATGKDTVEIDIADAINGYFAAKSKAEAAAVLSKADASYPDPRFGMVSPEERRKDMMAALFSTIVSSRIDHDSMADMLDVLSKVDVVVGRVSHQRRWSLLRYVGSMLAYGLYDPSKGKEIRYSQYSMPWPVMGPIFARSQTIRKLASLIAPAAHISRRTCGTFFLPYLVQAMITSGTDPAEFAANFEESMAESLAKEIDRAKGGAKK